MTNCVEKLAFDDFYEKYYSKVYWYIYKKINHPENAQDLAGDVFCACYKHYDKYDPEKSSEATWLFVIVNNRLKNYYRARKNDVPFDEQIDQQSLIAEDDMTKAIMLEDYREMLADAITTLPEKHQLIIILKFFGEKNSDEIATIMNMSSVNVRVMLSRSLKKISDYFVKRGWNGEI